MCQPEQQDLPPCGLKKCKNQYVDCSAIKQIQKYSHCNLKNYSVCGIVLQDFLATIDCGEIYCICTIVQRSCEFEYLVLDSLFPDDSY